MAIDYTRSLTKQGIKRENINKYFKDIGTGQKTEQSSGGTINTISTGTWYGPVNQPQPYLLGQGGFAPPKPPRPTQELTTNPNIRPEGMGPYHGSWTNPGMTPVLSPVAAQQPQPYTTGLYTGPFNPDGTPSDGSTFLNPGQSTRPNPGHNNGPQGNFLGILKRLLGGYSRKIPYASPPDYSNIGGALGPVDPNQQALQLSDAERLRLALLSRNQRG